jgi:ribose-phosphate pyrophosphokinase
VITLDLHTPTLEGFFRVAVDNLTAVPVLAEALRTRIPPNAVIVSPDVGAMRIANRYASALALPVAICYKQRVSATEVSVSRVTGNVDGRPCVIIDDMITTGGTIVGCIRALRAANALEDVTVAATHAVLAPGALTKIAAAGVRQLVVTDSIRLVDDERAPLHPTIVSVAPLLATAVRRVMEGGSLRELAYP